MVKQCIVSGCRRESFKNCGITFFKFPKDESMRQRWIDAVGRVTKYSVVCHLHFKPEDIISVSSKPKLSPFAVPSIFPNMKIQDRLTETISCLKEPVLDIKALTVPSTALELPCKQMGFSDTPGKKVQALRRQVKILRQRLRRRDEKVKEVKNILKMIKYRCSTYDEVKNVLRNNLIDKQTYQQIESKGDKPVNITSLS